ncbi:MAG: hypothetical protein Q3998_06535 [Porphyromonas sp.]|nr:hypothetical protein [Porphyromonas sp.]
MDKLARIITILTYVLIIALFLFYYPSGTVIEKILLCVMLLFFAGLAFLAPMYIQRTPNSIIIGKLLHKKVIDLSNAKVDRAPMDILDGAIRTFASGGIFGYWGYFYSKALGHFRLYITYRKGELLIIRRSGKKPIVINNLF